MCSYFPHIFLGTSFLSHNCCITCRASLALSCILLVRLNLNGSVLIRHFSQFKCTKTWRCPWHIFCSLAGFKRFLMCGLARWVHLSKPYTCLRRVLVFRCVLKTCTPECDWVYAFKCISWSNWSIGSFQKRSTLPPRRKFLPSGWGGKTKLFLIIVNVFRTSEGGRGVNFQFPPWG